MKAKTVLILVCVLLAVGASMAAGAEPAKKPAAAKKAAPAALAIANFRISGPYIHENLAIFLIHGEDRIKGKTFLTLKEALAKKKLVIRETGNVNKVTMENVGSVTVYAQSGEIVKGGKQDRMLQYDCIVPPKSGQQAISAFCVEQGRWSRRGSEEVDVFLSSNNNAVGNAMKLAAKLDGAQGKVWSKVVEVQGNLSANLGASVNSNLSQTSLQLSLENKKLKEAAAPYQKKHANILRGHKDAVGFAVAINGKITSLDMYACGALFAKLWPKLLETSAFEAVAEGKKGAKSKVPTAEDVRKFALEAEKAKAQERKINGNLRMKIRRTRSAALFVTTDADGNDIHSSVLAP